MVPKRWPTALGSHRFGACNLLRNAVITDRRSECESLALGGVSIECKESRTAVAGFRSNEAQHSRCSSTRTVSAGLRSDGQQIRAVDESQIKKLSEGSGDQMVNDAYLRSEFPPPGTTRAHRPGKTPIDLYNNGFSHAIAKLEETFTGIGAVAGDDERPVIEMRGVDSRECATWRDVLGKIDEELIIWASTFRRKFGTTLESSIHMTGEDHEVRSDEDNDPYSQAYESWDQVRSGDGLSA